MGSQICFWAVLVLTLVPCSAACCIFQAQPFPRSFTLWIDKILISETGPYTARPTCHTNHEPRDRPSSWPQVLCLLDGPRTLHLTLYLVPKSSYLQIPILSFSQESAQTSMKKAVSLPHRTWIGDYFLNGELCSWHGEDWKRGSSKKCGGSSTSHFCESQSALRRWTTFFFFKERCQKSSEIAALCKYTTQEEGFRGELFISHRHCTCKRWSCESPRFQEWMFSWCEHILAILVAHHSRI